MRHPLGPPAVFAVLVLVSEFARTHDFYNFAGDLGFVAFGLFVLAFLACN